jgi:hypothetical protein
MRIPEMPRILNFLSHVAFCSGVEDRLSKSQCRRPSLGGVNKIGTTSATARAAKKAYSRMLISGHLTFALWRVVEGAKRRSANVAHERAVRRHAPPLP